MPPKYVIPSCFPLSRRRMSIKEQNKTSILVYVLTRALSKTTIILNLYTPSAAGYHIQVSRPYIVKVPPSTHCVG